VNTASIKLLKKKRNKMETIIALSLIFINNTSKKKYCSEIVGIEIDIWIDDCPASIIFDYKELLQHI
jgi:hypothetical protein